MAFMEQKPAQRSIKHPQSGFCTVAFKGNRLITFLMAFLFWAYISTDARPRIPSLLSIPTADMLPHGLFQAHTAMTFFTVHDPEDDSSETFRYPFSSGVLLGFQDRAEFGVQYGDQVSLSFKAYVFEATEGLYYPDIALGARSVFGSQEGRLFAVRSNDTLDMLRNEAFIAFSLNYSENGRLHLGTSVIPSVDDGEAMFYLGVEQYMGLGVYLGYELFNRFLQINHNVNLIYKFKEAFSLSVGLTQVQYWLHSEDGWGFFVTPQEYSTNGYHSPGIKVAIAIGGFTLRNDKKTNRDQLNNIESEQQKMRIDFNDQQKKIEQVSHKVEQLERQNTRLTDIEKKQVTDYLDQITQKLNSDVPYDPREIADLRVKIIKLPPSSRSIMTRILVNPTTPIDHRVQVCIIMALSGQDEYVKPLLQATADPEARVRREAILALANMKLKVALEYAEILLDDTDESVVLAAKEAIRRIKESSGSGTTVETSPDVP